MGMISGVDLPLATKMLWVNVHNTWVAVLTLGEGSVTISSIWHHSSMQRQGLSLRGPAGWQLQCSNTSSGTPGIPQHLHSSLRRDSDVFFNQPGQIHAYKSFQASAIISPLPTPLPTPLGPFPPLHCFCRKQDRKDSVLSKCRRKSTDLELSGTGFAAQLCQIKLGWVTQPFWASEPSAG